MAPDNFENIELSSVAGDYRPNHFEKDTDYLDQVGTTQPLIRERKKKSLDENESETTEISLPPNVKMDPAVGWVVCIDGVDKGRSFRLVKGNNTIGRPGMGKQYDVSLTDQAISRKGVAGVIVYNEKSNQFFITPGDLATNVNPYLNDEILLSPKPLTDHAVIEIADDILIFVPFCCDKFKWKFDEAPKAGEGKQEETSGSGKDEIKRCPHGHFYNAAVNDSCPYCDEKNANNDPDGVTRIYY